ncbi:DUF4393 domain-containing protein [Vibrio parahaemolyticus]|uniref:DUF4393 domain-containing protein n=1 Tax=Vibrio diabolicus TaxID=50719 RepID=A0AAX1XFP3_9VIBR|nr:MULTISPECIES: Abi-alpha family protein [Vibrio]EJG0725892.1 DUF4393 domain-containing protein [Vibrio parahaemolyticus]EJG0800546.1 DUF4393 domain-containing protein [Vibrio parahaemolyticus]MBM4850969.1 DUF4393 domain-containing protein [Vibrio parahaemolyticus]NNN46280.1 DUF4393 domain-containing protein [Vibrio sp. 1-1(7)]NNN74169.1 DUF4393 domain-containing protein [Vibrio sp. 12-2(3-a)]
MSSDKATAVLAKGVVEFLGRICNPAADEIGLLLQDKVRAYRNKNFESIASKAEVKVNKNSRIEPTINPRLLYKIYEEGSWSESDNLQEMWAGLLSASCFDDRSDQNMIYVDLLSKMSSTEARLFDFIARSTKWSINSSTALPETNAIFPTIDMLKESCGISDQDDLDECLTHLSALGVINFENYPDIDSYTSTAKEVFSDYDFDDFFAPDWSYSVELSLTQVGYRLFIKTTGESVGLRQYIQKNHTISQRNEEFEHGW